MINEYYYEKLIIGGSLESLLYSFITGHKILLVKQLYPIEVTEVEYRRSLRLLGYRPNDKINLSELWDRLTFVLSLTSLNVTPNIISSHRKSGNNRITVVTQHNKRIVYYSDEFVYFDDIIPNKILMLDWFNVRSGNNHQFSVISDNKNNFINKVHFYKSKRSGRNNTMKDILATSIIKTSDSQSVNYSEGIARLKVLGMMKESGIRGQSNGYDKDGRRLHYALKIEHTYREYRKKYKPKYDIQQLLKQEPEKENRWNITKKLFRHKQITTLQESFRLPANL